MPVALAQMKKEEGSLDLAELFNDNKDLKPELILQKNIYDKVAAGIILEKFIKFYNNPE